MRKSNRSSISSLLVKNVPSITHRCIRLTLSTRLDWTGLVPYVEPNQRIERLGNKEEEDGRLTLDSSLKDHHLNRSNFFLYVRKKPGHNPIKLTKYASFFILFKR